MSQYGADCLWKGDAGSRNGPSASSGQLSDSQICCSSLFKSPLRDIEVFSSPERNKYSAPVLIEVQKYTNQGVLQVLSTCTRDRLVMLYWRDEVLSSSNVVEDFLPSVLGLGPRSLVGVWKLKANPLSYNY